MHQSALWVQKRDYIAHVHTWSGRYRVKLQKRQQHEWTVDGSDGIVWTNTSAPSSINGLHLEALRFQTVTEYPALSKLLACVRKSTLTMTVGGIGVHGNR